MLGFPRKEHARRGALRLEIARANLSLAQKAARQGRCKDATRYAVDAASGAGAAGTHGIAAVSDRLVNGASAILEAVETLLKRCAR